MERNRLIFDDVTSSLQYNKDIIAIMQMKHGTNADNTLHYTRDYSVSNDEGVLYINSHLRLYIKKFNLKNQMPADRMDFKCIASM